MNPWSLPGPRRLIDRTVDRLVGGGCFCAVLLRPLLCLNDVESALRSRLSATGWQSRMLVPGDQPLPRAILQGVGLPRRQEVTAHDVLHAPELAGVVFVYHATDMADMDVWRRFLGQVEIQARASPPIDPPRFIVLAPPAYEVGWEESTGYFITDIGTAMSPIDTLLLAFNLAAERNLKDHEAQLLCQVCASIALWDTELLARLVKASWEDVAKPSGLLLAYAAENNWQTTDPLSACTGMRRQFDTRLEMHSARLALSSQTATALASRVWAGQATVLLPVIEWRRQELVQSNRQFLQSRLPIQGNDGENILHASELEIGQISWILNSRGSLATAQHKNLALRLKHARNSLAHLKPLSDTDALYPGLHEPIK